MIVICKTCGLKRETNSARSEYLWRYHAYESPQCDSEQLALVFIVHKSPRLDSSVRRGQKDRRRRELIDSLYPPSRRSKQGL